MSAKIVFLCEANHHDHAMRIAESLVIKKLTKLGYNQLYFEIDATDLEKCYHSISKHYQKYKDALNTQIFRLFELSKQCLNDCEFAVGTAFSYEENKDWLNDSKCTIGAKAEAYIMLFEAVLQHFQVHGFEGASRKILLEGTAEFCRTLANKQTLKALITQNLTNNLSNTTDKYGEMRDTEIVSNLAKLYDSTFAEDKNIMIAGVEHCVDFYNYASKKGILSEFKFIQIKTDLTIILDADLGDIVLTDTQKDCTKFGFTYICGNSMSNKIYENLEYLGLINNEGENFECDAKYHDYVQDQSHVVRCDINVNDLDSYHACIHNVIHVII